MNAMTNINVQTLTMTSREIAEMTGKEHKHVRRDIEAMLSDVGEDRSKFGHIFLDAYGRKQPEYRLPKNLTLNLIAGYRADIRLKIIDRWIELEAANATPAFRVPVNLKEALKLALEQQEVIDQQQAVINEHIDYLTVAEFIALSHRYASHPEKVRIGVAAASLAKSRGVALVKSPRTIKDRWGNEHESAVNTYPRRLLEEVTSSSFMTTNQPGAFCAP